MIHTISDEAVKALDKGKVVKITSGWLGMPGHNGTFKIKKVEEDERESYQVDILEGGK